MNGWKVAGILFWIFQAVSIFGGIATGYSRPEFGTLWLFLCWVFGYFIFAIIGAALFLKGVFIQKKKKAGGAAD